jgi:hypothetical protein
MFSIILLPVLVLVILCKVYLKLKPYYEFSKKYKHYKGVPLNMIKVNPEGEKFNIKWKAINLLIFL